MTDRKIKRTIEIRIHEHRQWLTWAANCGFQEEQFDDIIQRVEREGLVALPLLAQTLNSLGHFYGTRGIIALDDRDGGGWSDISGAIECYLWCVRLGLRSHYSWDAEERKFRTALLFGRLPLAACLLANFLATAQVSREKEVWALLEPTLTDPTPRVGEWWRERCFEPFLMGLYAQSRGLAVPFDHNHDLGLYAFILKDWEDKALLATHLREVCDYHLLNMDNTRDRDAEFGDRPFDLIPAEVYAINTLRESAGSTAVNVDHPLMSVIGLPRPAVVPADLADILSRVQKKYEGFYPSSADQVR